MLAEMHCNNFQLVVTLLILVLECWLGRTEKTKANSIVELIFMGVVMVASFILIKWKGFKNGK